MADLSSKYESGKDGGEEEEEGEGREYGREESRRREKERMAESSTHGETRVEERGNGSINQFTRASRMRVAPFGRPTSLSKLCSTR